MRKKIFLALCLIFNLSSSFGQDLEQNLKKSLDQYFKAYTSSSVDIGQTKLSHTEIDHNKKTLNIYADARFGYQPFREENVQAIYRHLKQILPNAVANYKVTLYVGDKSIDDLIPNFYRSKNVDISRIHEPIKSNTRPWVSPKSRPYSITRGLSGRHISLWQSHGKYYINKLDRWGWQRPNLFTTNEDIFTQSFVIPYLIPMLENAGAIVYTPRERDTQRNEVIVDNDIKTNSLYIQEGKKKQMWSRYDGPGFAHSKDLYFEGENPFLRGTSMIAPTKRKKAKAFAQWVPTIPTTGEYAVYVTYQTTPQSVSDAQYLVFHQGGISEFSVNQRIGGGTWVYLGTFEFAKGNSPLGMVVLTNESSEDGVVSADAVRFGGGMGNIVRGNTTSGLPRYLEGARYSAQWAGMSTDIYSGKSGQDDYIDDINTRGNIINYISGGSIFNPKQEGLGVPLELNVALHSDAGVNKLDKIIGTLGIYTTEAKEPTLGTGKARISSRDFADIVLTNLERDIQSNFDIIWTRRSLWDRNYSETRLPQIPSMIIELLSHQNFADMRIAHDPNFKFIVARSIYKSVLAYLSNQSRKDYVVQPLPVQGFSAQLKGKNKVQLNWAPTVDHIEQTANAQEYIVYQREGQNGFDNGTVVYGTEYTTEMKPGVIYSFKVAAVNQGGVSFPSEVLVAYKSPKEKAKVLIVNGFQRLSGPQSISNDFDAGFDLSADPGVPYKYNISLIGNQQNFRRTGAGKSDKQSLGYSTDELEGYKFGGNTFDYPYIHGKAIASTAGISFTSSSREAVELGLVNLNQYQMVDLIMGLQKSEKYNPHSNMNYKTFTPELQERIRNYTAQGGSVLVSGSYLGSDMNTSNQDKAFIQSVLNYDYAYSVLDKEVESLTGLGQNAYIPRHLNEQSYTVSAPEVLVPVGNSFPVMNYNGIDHPAALASDGAYKTFIMGVPFESIATDKTRASIMSSILYFLLNLN